MRLDLMSRDAVAAHVAAGRRGVILPLGSLEPHGGPGALGTDAICAGAVADRAADLAGGIAAPVLAYGMVQFHLGAPGCVSLRPSTLSAVIFDAIVSLGMGGLTRVLLLTGHGGNVAPAQAAIQEAMAEVSLGRLRFPAPVSVKLRAWWDGPRLSALRRDLYGEREGFHVTPSEIAIAMAVHPSLAVPREAWPAYRAVAHDPLHDLGGDRHEDAARHAARFPDGPIASDPAMATAKDGERLLDAAAEDVAETFAAFEAAPDHSAR
jgi:creatinine amidohydrolase